MSTWYQCVTLSVFKALERSEGFIPPVGKYIPRKPKISQFLLSFSWNDGSV
jgi:hypothetical protein